MRVLLVSQYFAPEVGATQNRMAAFADGLAALGHDVTVVCEQPNHPAGVFQEGFGHRPLMVAREQRRTVHRLWVAASPEKTTLRRLAFYGTFAGGAAARIVTLPRHDVVFATSPPLPGALAAGAAAELRRTPFVLDVRDIWPAAAEALGELSNPRLLAFFERAERWLYGRAAAVTATTKPFCAHIDRVAGRAVSVHVPNGALDELIALPDAPRPADGPFVVGYAGNLGIAQGLFAALDAAERLRDTDVTFRIVGDGAVGAELRAERDRRGLDNVELRPGVPTAEVGALLQSCDALLVPLGAHPLLADFIPSKLYDAMAVGRPAIVAVAADGEAARLVGDSGCGVVVPPEDGEALATAVRELAGDRERARALGAAGRAAVGEHARSRQVQRLADVLRTAAAPRARS